MICLSHDDIMKNRIPQRIFYVFFPRTAAAGRSLPDHPLCFSYGGLPFRTSVDGFILYHHERADGKGPFADRYKKVDRRQNAGLWLQRRDGEIGRAHV
jgi:hypothetical protein